MYRLLRFRFIREEMRFTMTGISFVRGLKFPLWGATDLVALPAWGDPDSLTHPLCSEDRMPAPLGTRTGSFLVEGGKDWKSRAVWLGQPSS